MGQTKKPVVKAGFFVFKMEIIKFVKKIKINPSYKKDNGNFVLSFDDIPTPKNFNKVDQSIVYIKAGQIGGNHKHKRTEVFVGFGEGLEIYWLDKKGKLNFEKMNPNGELLVFFIAPFIPHAIKNNSKNSGVLIEIADSKQTLADVERVKVIE